MCANMEIYNKVREVPKEAVKAISAGRLKGKSDINPMWRIKMLTEIFGVCGFGWKTVIEDRWLEAGADGEVIANVRISLYVRDPQTKEWSDAIVGIGGAMMIAKEKNGMYNDDDAFKKAYTDAISIACKALGFCANIYYANDPTKYDAHEPIQPPQQDVPFPDVAQQPNVTPSPSILVGKPKEMTDDEKRQWALEYIPESSPLPGIKLGDLIKMDKQAYAELRATPPSIECAKAIQILDAWINAHRTGIK